MIIIQLSAAEYEDISFAIMEEFNIYLYTLTSLRLRKAAMLSMLLL